MKNLMGVIWDRGAYHRTDLHQTDRRFPYLQTTDTQRARRLPARWFATDRAEFGSRCRGDAHLAGVDRTSWHWTPPPRKCWGHQPADVRHVRIADQMKLGTMNLDQVEHPAIQG